MTSHSAQDCQGSKAAAWCSKARFCSGVVEVAEVLNDGKISVNFLRVADCTVTPADTIQAVID